MDGHKGRGNSYSTAHQDVIGDRAKCLVVDGQVGICEHDNGTHNSISSVPSAMRMSAFGGLIVTMVMVMMRVMSSLYLRLWSERRSCAVESVQSN